MPGTIELPLQGPGGEPVDLWRTIVSHGIASLPPSSIDEDGRLYETTLRPGAYAPRTVRISPRATPTVRVEVLGPAPRGAERQQLTATLRRVLALDEDLSPFYAAVATDPDLTWAGAGAGRMVRGPTVFEDVVKTICTTNCTWAATVRMTTGLVEHLGEASVGDHGRAFPTPAAMAAAPDELYREVVRAGYRGAYLRVLATSVADETLELEQLRAPASELPDDEVERRLLALPGVGPYAAAHMMMLLGRHSRLILDSWTRPTYARLTGRKKVSDSTIARRFRRYGPYAGLAFWLVLTRGWVDEAAS
jgi:3-methyladenine DNA glycosylase/8-oxoguanine DNA glycosylase